MYTQQFKRPPAGYSGTAIQKPCPEEAPREEIPVPPGTCECGRTFGADELLILAVLLIAVTGVSDRSPALVVALLFILL